jgi:hypothetical protein
VLQLALARWLVTDLHLNEYQVDARLKQVILSDVTANLLDQKDKTFKKKRGRTVRLLAVYVSLLNSKTIVPETDLETVEYILKFALGSTRLSLTNREYKERAKTSVGLIEEYRLVKKQPQSRSSPQFIRWMGVGYRDKGSRRDPARDGQPPWQEVARHFSYIQQQHDGSKRFITSKRDSLEKVPLVFQENESIWNESKREIRAIRTYLTWRQNYDL